MDRGAGYDSEREPLDPLTYSTHPHKPRTYFPMPCTAMAVAAMALESVGALGSWRAAKPSPT